MVEFPATLESKLDLVTRFIRDIRRVARKLGEGGAPFPELQELYDLADVFQTHETDEDLFSIRHQLWTTVKHTYRVIAPCGLGGDGPPWSTVEELLHETELLAKEVGNAKRAMKRRRSRQFLHDHQHSHSPTDSAFANTSLSFPLHQPRPHLSPSPLACSNPSTGSGAVTPTDDGGTRDAHFQIRRIDNVPVTELPSHDNFGDTWHPKRRLSDLASSSKRSRVEHTPVLRPTLPASTSASRSTEARPTPSRGSSLLDTPPSDSPRRRTWPLSDTPRPRPRLPLPSSYPSSVAFRDSPPLTRRPVPFFPLSRSRLPPPPLAAPWPQRLTIPDLSESSSRSQTQSQSPHIVQAPRAWGATVLPRVEFNEAYIKSRSTAAHDTYKHEVGHSPPPRSVGDVRDLRGRVDRPSIGWSPRSSICRPWRYSIQDEEGAKKSSTSPLNDQAGKGAVPSASSSSGSGAARPSPGGSPGHR